MEKPQWITAGIALLIVIGLFAATQKTIFGPPKSRKAQAALPAEGSGLSIDSILFHAKERLTPDQATRISTLEHSISRGDVKDQQLHIYHQLARFWSDSARVFEPFAWYTAEAARLENSEKSLTFAARLFLNELVEQGNPEIKQWEAMQAKDLFERSLKLNPASDSAKVGLGSVYVYGGIAMPMEGISMIKEVADRDTTNTYAQWALGYASMESGQFDKAVERFKRIARLDPSSLEAIFRTAEALEQMGNKAEAAQWYSKLLPMTNPAVKKEVEAKIAELRK